MVTSVPLSATIMHDFLRRSIRAASTRAMLHPNIGVNFRQDVTRFFHQELIHL